MAKRLGWLIALLVCMASPALGDEVSGAGMTEANLAYEDRIAELERTVKVLASELERTRAEVTVPEELPELKSEYGLGPAASKVYGTTRGLSIGGYGEAFYRNFVADRSGEKNTADFLRAVLYFGYKFTDSIVFNSEIEIEHADEIFLEFATLDFMWTDYLNARAGLLLIPMGFINELHEPPFFFGVNRPDVERFIIPTTWRENGAGIFGSWGEDFTYRLYAVNGFDGSGFSSEGLRGGRQKGSKALAEDFAATGRLDWTPNANFLLGGSFYVGNAGQDQDVEVAEGVFEKLDKTLTTLFDVHTEFQWKGLHLRGLFTMAFVDEAGKLSANLGDTIAEEMIGGYGEIAYNIWQWISPESAKSLEPFYRFSYYDTQWETPSGLEENGNFQNRRVHTVGFSFKPIPNVVIKSDYRNRAARKGSVADEFNLGIGYVF